MKKIAPEFLEHLGREVSSLATCWRMRLLDGSLMCFTDHDQDLTIEGDHYLKSSGLSSSAIESNSSLNADNLQISGILNSELIIVQDLMNGRYDSATVEIFAIDYNQPSAERLFLKKGKLGKIFAQGNKFYIETLGLSIQTQARVGERFSKLCRADFCDARCSLNPANYRDQGSVSAVLNSFSFYGDSSNKASGYYDGGILFFTTGLNTNRNLVVKNYRDGHFSLYTAPPSPILEGDQYKVLAGCNKSFETCISKFDNHKNFRGEPYIEDIV